MRNGRYEENGIVSWYRNGLHHREDGPAIEGADGYKAWWVDGNLHRLDGPARIWSDGTKEWWVDGKRHREDGPAIEMSDGRTKWFVDGRGVDIWSIFGYDPSIPLNTEEQMILRLSL